MVLQKRLQKNESLNSPFSQNLSMCPLCTSCIPSICHRPNRPKGGRTRTCGPDPWSRWPFRSAATSACATTSSPSTTHRPRENGLSVGPHRVGRTTRVRRYRVSGVHRAWRPVMAPGDRLTEGRATCWGSRMEQPIPSPEGNLSEVGFRFGGSFCGLPVKGQDIGRAVLLESRVGVRVQVGFL